MQTTVQDTVSIRKETNERKKGNQMPLGEKFRLRRLLDVFLLLLLFLGDSM